MGNAILFCLLIEQALVGLFSLQVSKSHNALMWLLHTPAPRPPPSLSFFFVLFCYYCFLKDSSDSSVCGLRARSVNRTTEMKFSWLPCFNVGDQQTWVPEGFHPICGVDSLAKSNTTVRSHQAPSPHAPKCLISDCVWGFFTFLKYNSVFHYTLATTTGGKDSGLPIGYQKMTAWPNMFALLSLVGLGCCFLLFLFFFPC